MMARNRLRVVRSHDAELIAFRVSQRDLGTAKFDPVGLRSARAECLKLGDACRWIQIVGSESDAHAVLSRRLARARTGPMSRLRARWRRMPQGRGSRAFAAKDVEDMSFGERWPTAHTRMSREYSSMAEPPRTSAAYQSATLSKVSAIGASAFRPGRAHAGDMARRQPVHADRGRAEGFGLAAADYDRYRPRYPRPLITELIAGPVRALDVGAGTGIASAQLMQAGAHVLAVEPDPRMARVAANNGIPVEQATFEDWQPCGRSFDLVLFAQSFHWVQPQLALDKITSILRAGGRLALLSNRITPYSRPDGNWTRPTPVLWTRPHGQRSTRPTTRK